MAPRRHERVRRAAVRDLLGVVVLVGLLMAAWQHRTVPNETYPPARNAAAALDALEVSWQLGELDLGTDPQPLGDGLTGARLEREGTPTRWVVVAATEAGCLARWWDERGFRSVRAVPDTVACAPTAAVANHRAGASGRVTAQRGEDPDWGTVLPEPQRQRWWFLLAVAVGGALVAARIINLTLLALTGEPGARASWGGRLTGSRGRTRWP